MTATSAMAMITAGLILGTLNSLGIFGALGTLGGVQR